ncbi:MAG: NAD-dependent epimerase/dehydratase family protein, partial [Syntrophobacteria bacterium]
DLGQHKSLERMLKSVDMVIHLGARATFEPYKALRPSIVEGSINLMRAAIEAGVKTFVYGGSLLVYGEQAKPITQQTAAAPNIGYSRAKLEAETILLKMAADAGIRFTSMRLPHTYGVNSLLFNQMRRGTIIFPGKGNNLFAHLHVVDAARALIKAAEDGKAGISVIADNTSCTWSDFFAITQHYYPRLRIIRVPKWGALAGTGTLDVLYRFTPYWNRFSVGAVKSWTSNLPVEPNTFKDIVGIEPMYPTIEQGIPAALDDCISYYWCHSLEDNH